MKKVVVVFGLGYVAEFISRYFLELGYRVYITSRRVSGYDTSVIKGASVVNFLDIGLLSVLRSANIVLSTVPPDINGIDPVLSLYSKAITTSNLCWVGYLSSTNVYGDHQGNWVTEESKCTPSNSKSRIRLLAEKKWLDIYRKFKVPVHIMRLSGIYGPGRNCLEQIINGKNFTIVKKGHYFSRIHVKDICMSIVSSVNNPTPGEIYNVTDDEPAALDEVQQYGAKIINGTKLIEVNFINADISNEMRNFFFDNKKVSNKKISDALGIRLYYPDYRVGLLEGCLPYL